MRPRPVDPPTPQSADFAEILEAAKQGEEWAWSLLFNDLLGTVTGYLAGRGAPDPDDAASETMLQVARNIHRFHGDQAGFRSWVFLIAHRRLIDARRAASRRPTLVTIDEVETAHPSGNVEDEAIEVMIAHEIEDSLQILTDDQREVLLLRVVGDLSLEQTANVMGKRTGAIKALQRRGLGALRAHLETHGVSR